MENDITPDKNMIITHCVPHYFLWGMLSIVSVTVVRTCNGVGLNKESKHYTLRVLYYAAVTA